MALAVSGAHACINAPLKGIFKDSSVHLFMKDSLQMFTKRICHSIKRECLMPTLLKGKRRGKMKHCRKKKFEGGGGTRKQHDLKDRTTKCS